MCVRVVYVRVCESMCSRSYLCDCEEGGVCVWVRVNGERASDQPQVPRETVDIVLLSDAVCVI